ncbi:DUF6428 family protein [Algoriphagus resistens]|uniref:DUF6428 family protein n=1 Tax=Algoriphagus resistens TaxID=1750590 RepID=UPI0007168968|nr:DUF6428 family protein [Algoriphagus resistens]
MRLSEVKQALSQLENIAFQLPDGTLVPTHFHVTEVGKISKHFIDCGGTVRTENVANFQLWDADDYNHRLYPEKLNKIIELSENVLGLEDLEVEVEYQGETIGKFGLEFDGTNFLLVGKQTDCLAKDNCGIPQGKQKLNLSDIPTSANSCAPGSGCC